MADVEQVSDVILDRSNPFEAVLGELVEMHRRKSADYGADDNEYENFDRVSAMQGITPLEFCNIMVALKQARLAQLLESGRDPVNESVEDTLIDRAVYAVIAVVLSRRDAA